MTYCTPTESRKAAREHRCTCCGYPIVIGETYARWVSYDDGKAHANKMHRECLEACQEDAEGGYFEYTPYGGEPPERLTREETP